MSDADKLRDELAERDKNLSKEERNSEWLFIYDEECSQKRKRLAAGQYMSILPLDPFTASAELLNLIVLGGLEETALGGGPPSEPASEGGQQVTAIPSEHRSKVISKKKAANLLGRPNPDSGVKWLNDCIKDGTIRCEEINRQAFVFDKRQFPNKAQSSL